MKMITKREKKALEILSERIEFIEDETNKERNKKTTHSIKQ